MGTPLNGSIGHDLWPLSVGSSGYVTLRKGYNVPSKTHHKFGDQRSGPFKVFRVLPNAYELVLPATWAVHPVISVEHLEPHPKTDDPYNGQFATEILSPVYSADGDWGDMVRIVGSRL